MVNDYAVPTGGAEIILAGQRDLLRKRGHEVTVFASDAELVPGLESFADHTCKGSTSKAQVALSCCNPWAAWALARLMTDFRPDLVHVKMFLWQLSPSILRHLEGTPSIYQIVTYKPICPKGTKILPDGRRCEYPAGWSCLSHGCLTPQSWVAFMLQRRLWLHRKKSFTRFVTVSQTMRRRLEENGIGPCHVILNGCPSAPPRGDLSLAPLFVYAGRLSSEKGVETMLQAMRVAIRRQPEMTMLIAGDGPDRRCLEKIAGELGVSGHVRFLGNLDRGSLEKLFNPAWAQIVPSLWEEPFGLVTIEAMMRGTAVIASNHGGPAECVDEGRTGLLFEPGNADALAAAMLRLADNKSLCEQMGREGRDVALRNFSLEKNVDAWEACYAETVRKHKNLLC